MVFFFDQLVSDRLALDKTRRLIAKNFSTTLEGRKYFHIYLQIGFIEKSELISMRVQRRADQLTTFESMECKKRGSKRTHLENPINFEGLFSGKPAMKICFHDQIGRTQFIENCSIFYCNSNSLIKWSTSCS